MCNCLENLKKSLIKKGDFKGKQIINAEFPIAFMTNGQKDRLYTDVSIEVEGMKKKQSISMIHNFCAFCGQKID